jgi:hypothetical protein
VVTTAEQRLMCYTCFLHNGTLFTFEQHFGEDDEIFHGSADASSWFNFG